VKDDRPFLGTIWPADEKTERTMTTINRDLTRPKIGSVNKGHLKVGDELPRFALYNQNGDLVTPADLENKVVVLNFIFTRSTVPSMSAATAKRMAELQDRLQEAKLLDSVVLLSLSLDPEFDTPGICYSYLQEKDVDHDSYWMLTGSRKTLDFITKKIGVVSAPSEKTIINHSMVLLIVDREGKVFHRIPGTRWKLENVYGRLEILLKNWN
jgi:protein SCO1/2